MSEKIVWLDFSTVEKFIFDVFKSLGVPEEDAKVCADVLISADKKGFDSHGIGRLKLIYYDRIKAGIQNPVSNFEIIKETPTTAVIDGHNGMGHAIAKKAMRLAIDKAKKFGMGMTAVRNSTHFGIAGYYANMATETGLIGIVGTNARPSVAPTFGVENMLGTNPLCLGVPTDEEFPFILDCATSITQRGSIELYDKLNKKVPEGWVIGIDGKSRTDTHQILEDLNKGLAALTPLGGIGVENGGYKGFGYCTFVEILSAALAQGSFMKMLLGVKDGKKTPINLGHFFMAIDVGAFIEPDLFRKTAGDILRGLRASRKAPGQDKIYTAGEKEYYTLLNRKSKGVPINETLKKEMLLMRDEQNLKGYDSLF